MKVTRGHQLRAGVKPSLRDTKTQRKAEPAGAMPRERLLAEWECGCGPALARTAREGKRAASDYTACTCLRRCRLIDALSHTSILPGPAASLSSRGTVHTEDWGLFLHFRKVSSH